jgi:hypothetical protein
MGDFDGTSACELLNVLEKSCNGVYKVFIHTSSLKNIYPFDRDILHRDLRNLRGQPFRILFTGENAIRIAPEKSLCL